MNTKAANYSAIIACAAESNVDTKELARELWFSMYRDKKLGEINEIFEAAQEVLDRSRKQIRAQVKSSSPLDEADKNNIINFLKQKYSREIIIENIIDTSLGAGIEIKIGPKTFDYSLKARIQQLTKKMKEKYEI